MQNDRRRGRKLVTAARPCALAMGTWFFVVVVRILAVAVCVRVLFGNNIAPYILVIAFDCKLLAVVGEDVRGPDQWPDDDQSPSYAQEKDVAQFWINDSQYISPFTPGIKRESQRPRSIFCSVVSCSIIICIMSVRSSIIFHFVLVRHRILLLFFHRVWRHVLGPFHPVPLLGLLAYKSPIQFSNISADYDFFGFWHINKFITNSLCVIAHSQTEAATVEI